jgi:membrane-associated phospholipid phosphatase
MGTMTDKTAFRKWLIAFASTAIAVVICDAYVDRPVANFFEQNVRHTIAWSWIERALSPLDYIVLAALMFLLVCGLRAMFGGALATWTHAPLLCSWAAMWAVAAQMIFKRVFGRGWPDPTYVQDHLYGFHWLQGGLHWESFPSGTATISVAIASVIWIAAPRWRGAAALAASLLCIAVVVTNDHWVGDVLAGAFLGANIGWMTIALQSPAQRR